LLFVSGVFELLIADELIADDRRAGHRYQMNR